MRKASFRIPRKLWTAALVLCAVSALFEPSAASALSLGESGDKSRLLSPPTEGGKPVTVKVSLDILNIPGIDEVHEQFTLVGYLLATWTDPRLALKAATNSGERILEAGDVWTPSLAFINATAPRESHDVSLTVAPDGTMHYAERFRAVLSNRLRLEAFPFDRQKLAVRIRPYINDAAIERLVPDSSGSRMDGEERTFSSLAQWDVNSLTAVSSVSRSLRGTTVAEVTFVVSATRRYAFYVWKIFLPLVLMVVLSWTVFWLDPNDLSNQVQIAVTTILTVIAFAFAIEATMPRTSYLTLADAFFLSCYVFVFISVVELMSVHVALRTGARERAARIRRASRWAVPAAFLAINGVIAAYFLA